MAHSVVILAGLCDIIIKCNLLENFRNYTTDTVKWSTNFIVSFLLSLGAIPGRSPPERKVHAELLYPKLDLDFDFALVYAQIYPSLSKLMGKGGEDGYRSYQSLVNAMASGD